MEVLEGSVIPAYDGKYLGMIHQNRLVFHSGTSSRRR